MVNVLLVWFELKLGELNKKLFIWFEFKFGELNKELFWFEIPLKYKLFDNCAGVLIFKLNSGIGSGLFSS